MKFLDKYKKRINKSSSYLKKNIERIVLNNKIDEKILNEIEDLLITADLGTKVSKKLVNKLRYEGAKKDIKLKDLQLLLGRDFWYQNENPHLRAVHGAVYLKEMDVETFLTIARELEESMEGFSHSKD